MPSATPDCFQALFLPVCTITLYDQLWASQVAQYPPASAGDMGSIPGSGRSPGGGNGNPLQYFCLENPMDRGAWWATVHGAAKKSDRTEQLSTHTHFMISFTLHTSRRRKLGPRGRLKKLSCDEWLKKMWSISTMEHYSVIKKNETMHLYQHGCT